MNEQKSNGIYIPLIRMKKGRIWDPATKRYGDADPFDVVDKLSHKYDFVYIEDAGGIESNMPELDLLNELVDYGRIWIDTGPRRWDDAFDLVVVGAEKSVISLEFINIEDVKKLLEYSNEFAVRYVTGNMPNYEEFSFFAERKIWQIVSTESPPLDVKGIASAEMILIDRESSSKYEDQFKYVIRWMP